MALSLDGGGDAYVATRDEPSAAARKVFVNLIVFLVRFTNRYKADSVGVSIS